uniref:DUF3730 domain-containing protein n=1 Tax=Oncorhynchus mykiss TaxID=8022 RepID=A0A8K9UM34_ONCMY
MSENLKKRFDFPSPLIQAQTVRSLVAAVLKEKGQNERIGQSSTQGPAMEALWEQCCSDCAAVRSACCDAVVLLVEQAHADLHYILNSVLNLLPSARNVQGLIKVIGRLLQVQADQRDKGTSPKQNQTNKLICYRSSPHPYIIVLENRPDCWPVLLLEIDDFIQQAADRGESVYVTMLAPFLRYLYCEPQRLPEYALLRHSLLRVLLPPQPGDHNQEKKKDQETEEDPGQSPVVCHSLVRCLYELLRGLVEAMIPALEVADWGSERAQLALQLLCACQLSLKLSGDCRPLLQLLHQLLPTRTEVSQPGKPKYAPKLRAVALRLMTALWEKQDRVYPDLQRLISQFEKSVLLGKEAQWEQILARAACVRDICRERPYQHGGDMLAAITHTLAQCSRPDQAAPAALALQGLHELCRTEVVDVGSTWTALGPKLSCDSRPLVVKAIAELLALLPQLTVKTEEYEVHHLSSKSEPEVASCGYKALSEFSEAAHTLLHLPEQVRVPLDRRRSPNNSNMPLSPLFQFLSLSLTTPLCSAFELFLTSLVRQEMSQMPRGVYHSALKRGSLRSDQGKTVAGIPGFMLKTYEKSKQPGLKPGLAAGLLLSFDLPVQTDRDGRPINRFLLSRGRSYQQMLATLIHEVNIQPSEWHRALLLPQAWRGFMSRAYHAVLQGRRAELEMQQKQGKEKHTHTHLSLNMLFYSTIIHAIARSCAALALSLVVPVLVAWHKDSVPQVLATLRAGLPGSPTADDSQAVQFHSGLALGMLLSCLHQERLSDVSGQKITELLMSSLDTLEACCFDSNLEYNAGCVLGLGLVLGALSGSGQTEHRARVGLTLDKLLEALQGDSSSQGRMLQEVLAYSVAGVGVAAFSGGVVDALKSEEIMSTLRSMTEESQQTPGFSLALGVVVHGLSSCGHGKAEDIQPRLLDAWIKILLAEGCPTMQRLAAVNGLVALVGSETGILQVSLPTCSAIITFSGAIGLQSNSACLVGHLHLSSTSLSLSLSVPQDFSYLPEKSVIRSVVDFLTEAGKKGPEFAHPSLVKTALSSLATVGGSYQYPPVNWSAILSPLMRLNFGEVVQHQCIELASNQAQSSQSASLFLGVWLSPPLVHSLSMWTRGHLYDNLSVWMKHVSEDKLQVYVETLGLQQFQQDVRPQRLAICLSLLRGLAQAMALPNPPNTVWAVLCTTIEKIFNVLPNHIQDQEVHLYVGVSKCLSELADTEIDRIMEKTSFILAHLTSQGRVPLLGLNDVIAAVLRGWSSHKVGWLLLQTFYQCRLAASPNTGVSKRMEWLLELMGLIRNVAYGVTAATDFLLQVFAAAVISWGDHTMPLLLGVRTQWFPWQQGSEPPGLPHALYGDAVLAEQSVSLCLLGLPHSLRQLLAKEPWREQSQKVGPQPPHIDHFVCVMTMRFTMWKQITKDNTTHSALLALKSSTDFKKKAVWTRAYGW